MDKIAPVKKWDNLHAGREDMVIEFFNLCMERGERLVRISALPQQDNPFHHIVVVEYGAVGTMNGFSIPPQPNLWALCDAGDVADTQRSAALRRDYRLSDVLNTAE